MPDLSKANQVYQARSQTFYGGREGGGGGGGCQFLEIVGLFYDYELLVV